MFNFDVDDAEDVMNRFERHARAVGKSVEGLRATFGRVREMELGKAFSFV